MSEIQVFGGSFAFPATSNVPWSGPKPVHHYVYKLRQSKNWKERKKGLPEKSLVLFKQEEQVGRSAETAEQAAAIATDIARDRGHYAERNSSSVHINRSHQCWIILELDRKTNWRFFTGHPAITTKKPETRVLDAEGKPVLGTDGKPLQGFNADLHYVFVMNDEEPDPAKRIVRIETDPARFPADKDCHIVFFRMTHREPDKSVGMNFAVELYGSRRGGNRHGLALSPIPLIIDPDVPNVGDPPPPPDPGFGG